ncbi:MAG TPA: PepSY domain-containing protein, partial [Stellaceae bacterium]|nr:PepSY domain-containing protein [Stellaceae bacterium]
MIGSTRIRKTDLPAIFAALALAGAPLAYAMPALAAPAPAADGQSPAASAPASRDGTQLSPAKPAPATAAKPQIRHIRFSDRVGRRDIAAFGASKLSLDQAIAAAEGQLHGRVVEATFRADGGHPHYLVRVMARERISTAAVDAASGQVTRSGHAVALDRLYPGERGEFLRTAEARTNLAQAVAFAEKSTGAKPIAASLEGNHSTRGY